MAGKNSTGCVPEDTTIEFFDSEALQIKQVPVLWESNINRKGDIIKREHKLSRDGEHFVKTGDIGSFMPPKVRTLGGENAFPIFRVEGTELCPLLQIKFERDICLGLTNAHPVVLNDGTVTRAICLTSGKKVRAMRNGQLKDIKVLSVEQLETNVKVFNLALGNEELFNTAKSTLIQILGNKERKDAMVSASDEVSAILEVFIKFSQENFAGSEAENQIIFTNGIATGSYTMQHMVVNRRTGRAKYIRPPSGDCCLDKLLDCEPITLDSLEGDKWETINQDFM